MRALVQRVSEAAVRVDGAVIGEIAAGLLILVCAMEGDSDDAPEKLAAKIAKLRIFPKCRFPGSVSSPGMNLIY